MKPYLLALATILCTSTLAKATPPPIPIEYFQIPYNDQNEFLQKKEIAKKLCNLSDPQSPATKTMCLYAQGNLSESCCDYKMVAIISFKTMKEFIETLHASKQACYYGRKKDITTQIMCDYSKANQKYFDWLLAVKPTCFQGSYIYKTIQEINYCFNDGYRGFNHP